MLACFCVLLLVSHSQLYWQIPLCISMLVFSDFQLLPALHALLFSIHMHTHW